jgi:hypothetical protein
MELPGANDPVALIVNHMTESFEIVSSSIEDVDPLTPGGGSSDLRDQTPPNLTFSWTT